MGVFEGIDVLPRDRFFQKFKKVELVINNYENLEIEKNRSTGGSLVKKDESQIRDALKLSIQAFSWNNFLFGLDKPCGYDNYR